ncbi:MAG: MBL fold metallo-hydrolase [Candidatus Dormibacteraceae bacterium]
MSPSGRLLVLGSCGAWPEPGRACAGFLLEHRGFRIVLDLGYGTLPRLLSALDSTVGDGLDAALVTHRHPDHCVDLHGLLRARWFGRRGAPPLPLYAPEDVVDRLVELEDGDRGAVDAVFRWHPLPAPPAPVGPFWLTSVPVPHYVPTAGVRLAAPDLIVAYTADAVPDPCLVELGRDADLFIVDATTRDQQPGSPPSDGVDLDLRDVDAGRLAAAAGAHRLLLTHFWPGNDREASRQAAAQAYPGPIQLAGEGLSIDL